MFFKPPRLIFVISSPRQKQGDIPQRGYERMMTVQIDRPLMERMGTNSGKSLWALTFEQPIMLVFLREFGCTFCREAMSDIAKRREAIRSQGADVVFVHMADSATAERYFTRFNLEGVKHISDPNCEYYAAFGLVKGTFTQLYGLHSWIRGFQSAVVEGNGFGFKEIGDGFQMPGVFMLYKGVLRESYIHKMSHDRPDYEALVTQCVLHLD